MPEITYLSLGWGIQSFTIAAMAALGKIPPIDLAIHADTTHEASGTYEHARKWTPWLGKRGLPVVTVAAPNTNIFDRESKRGIFIPAITVDRNNGSKGMLSRQCTNRWKIRPIRTKLRELLDRRPRTGDIRALIGISLDEWHRMRSSDVKYIENVYPLVDLRMTRQECIAWLQDHGLDIPPKSSCVFCPYHSPSHWKALKREAGTDWDYAVAADAAIREGRPNHTLFVHRNGLPLETAVRIPEDYGAQQMELDMPCDGGVCFN